MTTLLKNEPIKKPAIPTNVVGKYVCNLTGGLVPEEGCESHYEYFKSEFVPTERITIKRNVLIDKDTGKIVQEGENKPNSEWQEHQVVRDAVGEWVCLDCPLAEGVENKPAILN